MHTLRLYLSYTKVADFQAYSLAKLKYAPLLRILSLDLSHNAHMGDDGARALAFGLREAPLLHTICLIFFNADVGDHGARALACLKDTPSLHTLRLGLSHTKVGDVGARSLASLKDAVSLHTLSLDLSGTRVGNLGANTLAKKLNRVFTPIGAPLRILSLDLSGTRMGNSGAQGLAYLGDAPLLQTLSLDVSCTKVRSRGAKALSDQLSRAFRRAGVLIVRGAQPFARDRLFLKWGGKFSLSLYTVRRFQ